MWGIKVHTNTSDGKKAEGGEIDTGRQDAWFPESDQRVSARGACSAGFEVEVAQVCNFTNEPLISLPKAITHEHGLRGCTGLLEQFLHECGHLGDRLGCLLVQLPPSLAFDVETANQFFTSLRKRYRGWLAVEPRHRSWATALSMLVDFQVAQVAASPSRFGVDARPGGWHGLVYWRLHGEPQIYRSAYERDYLQRLAAHLQHCDAARQPTWCVFDNTASGAALGDALATDAWLHGGAAA